MPRRARASSSPTATWRSAKPPAAGSWNEVTEATFLSLDLADCTAVERFAAALAERFSRIDGLVNNAALATGIGGKSFEEIDVETWDRVMTVNVRGTWLVTRACAPLLRKAQRAKIVNIASDTALWGAPRLLHYVASKGAVIAMTRSLARELGPDGIAVNAIAPGLVRRGSDRICAPRQEPVTLRSMRPAGRWRARSIPTIASAPFCSCSRPPRTS